jgi:hypothetical protein
MLMLMTDLQHLANRYIAVWNESNPTLRRQLIAEVFTSDATYTDPLAAVQGHDGIDQFVAAAQAQFAGLQFSLGTAVDSHHQQARFTWHLAPANAAEPVVIGFDVVVASESEARLREVYGFIDKAPSPASA